MIYFFVPENHTNKIEQSGVADEFLEFSLFFKAF